MGGDGGVVATNRKYMRGAGSADHTGDHERSKQQQTINMAEAMSTCAMTKTKLPKDSPIVACPYGRLYSKEAAVQALLRRKTHNNDGAEDTLGEHIRKLSDLYDVRFHYDNDDKTTCPITGKALNGSIPAILCLPGKPESPNVISESAFQQLSSEELETEYGPIQKKVRLAPPLTLLEQIRIEVKQQHLNEEEERKNKKSKKKKRKREGGEEKKEASPKNRPKAQTNSTNAARTRVETAIQSNKVLSSLFTTKRSVSEKEHKDNLFAR